MRILLFCLCLAALPARADVLTWGIETWECGTQIWNIQIGNGGDVALRSIAGVVSASASSGSVRYAGITRQSLLSVLATADFGNAALRGRVLDTPAGARVNHAVEDHLLDVNIKQRAETTPHVPVSYAFAPPVVVPGGRLTAVILTESYSSHPIGVVRGNPHECLNTEVHLTLQFDRANPSPTASAKSVPASPP